MLKFVLIYMIAGGLGSFALLTIFGCHWGCKYFGCSLREFLDYVKKQPSDPICMTIAKTLLWMVAWPLEFPLGIWCIHMAFIGLKGIADDD